MMYIVEEGLHIILYDYPDLSFGEFHYLSYHSLEQTEIIELSVNYLDIDNIEDLAVAVAKFILTGVDEDLYFTRGGDIEDTHKATVISDFDGEWFDDDLNSCTGVSKDTDA